jgi:hypothetical protein
VPKPTKTWFPLRSNVAYFETMAPRLDLESRVKEITLLTEELWFEDGMLNVTVGDNMIFPSWHPPPPSTSMRYVDGKRR